MWAFLRKPCEVWSPSCTNLQNIMYAMQRVAHYAWLVNSDFTVSWVPACMVNLFAVPLSPFDLSTQWGCLRTTWSVSIIFYEAMHADQQCQPVTPINLHGSVVGWICLWRWPACIVNSEFLCVDGEKSRLFWEALEWINSEQSRPLEQVSFIYYMTDPEEEIGWIAKIALFNFKLDVSWNLKVEINFQSWHLTRHASRYALVFFCDAQLRHSAYQSCGSQG